MSDDVRARVAGYPDADLDKIIEAAGGLPEGEVNLAYLDDEAGCIIQRMDRREALRRRMNNALAQYFIAVRRTEKPTDTQLTSNLTKIEKSASKLLAALALPPDMDDNDPLSLLPDTFRHGVLQAQAALEAKRRGNEALGAGEHLLRNAIRAVYQLRDWAKAAGERSSCGNSVPRNKRHRGDPALDAFLDGLALIWVEIFGKVPGMSVRAPSGSNEGDVEGAFVAFVMAAVGPIVGKEKKPSAKAVRARYRRLAERPGTTAAIVKMARKASRL